MVKFLRVNLVFIIRSSKLNGAKRHRMYASTIGFLEESSMVINFSFNLFDEVPQWKTTHMIIQWWFVLLVVKVKYSYALNFWCRFCNRPSRSSTSQILHITGALVYELPLNLCNVSAQSCSLWKLTMCMHRIFGGHWV